jgi:hypothetical protein
VETKFLHYTCDVKMLVPVDCSEASVMAEMCPLQNAGAVTLKVSISGPLRGNGAISTPSLLMGKSESLIKNVSCSPICESSFLIADLLEFYLRSYCISLSMPTYSLFFSTVISKFQLLYLDLSSTLT